MNPSRVLRQGLNQLARATHSRKEEILKEGQQVILTGVPRTATPADVRRAINRIGVRGVSDVAIDYEFFKPAERAILTFVSPEYVGTGLRTLKNLYISGIPVSSTYYTVDLEVNKRSRMRGYEGRKKAADRGALTGQGPNAGISNNERTVTMAGLPARTTVAEMALVLKDFEIAQSKRGLPQIVKLPLPPNTFSMTSRFLVTLTSVTEAHHLVRKLNVSYMKVYGEESLITANIIY